MKRIDLSPAALAGYDCVLIATNHAAYDWQLVADHAKLIVDTRNAMAKIKSPKARVVKA